PVVRTEIRQPIVIEAVVPETLMLGVAPAGLAWIPRPGTTPGFENERGRHFLVNGQPWYIEQMRNRQFNLNGELAVLWRILFGVRDCQVRLLGARPEGDGPHDAGRVSFELQTNTESGITLATVKNRAPQPTRIALAVSFDQPGTLVPLL